VPKQHIILKDTSLKLKVTLKTHGFKWLKYYLEAPKIDIDFLNDVKKNKGYYNELKTSVTQSLNLQLPPHSSNVSFSNKAVVITAQVKKFTEGTLKVPIRLINTPKNIVVKFFPKWIHVKYYTSLDNFKNITTKDFVVQCDFNKVKDGQSFLMPELVKTPKDVKYAKINQKHIEFIILK